MNNEPGYTTRRLALDKARNFGGPLKTKQKSAGYDIRKAGGKGKWRRRTRPPNMASSRPYNMS